MCSPCSRNQIYGYNSDELVGARFGEKLLRDAGVNLTELDEEDLRCGGLLLATNLTYNTLNHLAEDCMLQKCSFR
jgi:hypothetical protein